MADPCEECAARAAAERAAAVPASDAELVALLRHAVLLAVLALAIYLWRSGLFDKMMAA